MTSFAYKDFDRPSIVVGTVSSQDLTRTLQKPSREKWYAWWEYHEYVNLSFNLLLSLEELQQMWRWPLGAGHSLVSCYIAMARFMYTSQCHSFIATQIRRSKMVACVWWRWMVPRQPSRIQMAQKLRPSRMITATFKMQNRWISNNL